MLLVAPVRGAAACGAGPEGVGSISERLREKRSDLPAVTHVDCTARIQTVGREDNPRYHELLGAFDARTGCPAIVNTSFNVRGEPIVMTPADAYRCFVRTGMDHLVMGNYMIDKQAQDGGAHAVSPLNVVEKARGGATLLGELRSIRGGRYELGRFGLTLGLLAALIGFISFYGGGSRYPYSFTIGAALVVVALSLPTALWPLHRAWMAFGVVAGWIVTRLILALVFCLVVSPLGLVARATGKRFLELKIDPGAGSYWIPAGRDAGEEVGRRTGHSGIATLLEIFRFLRERRRWWLAPVVVVLLLIGALLVISEGSAIAPFIYTLF